MNRSLISRLCALLPLTLALVLPPIVTASPAAHRLPAVNRHALMPHRPGGPQRDDLGDVITQFDLPYRENAGMKWDGHYIWCTCRTATRHLFSIDPADYRVVNEYQLDQSDAIGLGWDPDRQLLLVCEWQKQGTPSICHLYDRDGNDQGQFDLPRSGHWDFCYDGEYFYGNSENDHNDPKLYKLKWNDNQDAFDVVAEGPNIVAAIGDSRAISIEYVPAHGANRFWVMSNANMQTGHISQIEVNWDDNSAEVLQQFVSKNSDYPHEGLTHDGYNLWAGGTWGGTTGYVYDDGIEEVYGVIALSLDTLEFGPVPVNRQVTMSLWIYNLAEAGDHNNLILTLTDQGDAPNWLGIDPTEGDVAPGDSLEVKFTATTEGVDLGDYNRNILLESTDIKRGDVILPAHIFVVEGFGRLSGNVTDAATGIPVEGALVEVAAYNLSATTDAEGFYEFADIPAWTYDLTASHRGYLPLPAIDVVIHNGDDIDLDFALLHSEFDSDPTFFNKTLPADTTAQYRLTITNNGNGPLTWDMILEFPRGVNQPPWDLRESFAVGDEVNDSKIQGVVFIDGLFYVAGGEKDTNYIYVIDREGHKGSQFAQMGAARYGYTDLDYDGELIWGASGNTFYGFTAGGDSVASFASPVNTPQAIAWDPVDSLFWISGLSGDIYGVNRQGQQVGQRIRLANFQVYGLAFYPDDPDGRPLYIMRQYGDSLMVTKTSTALSDTMWVATLQNERGGKAGGAFITRRYDPYSWVFISTANATDAQGGDRVDVWQLKANTGWVSVDQLQGVTDAGADANLTVSLNTQDMLEAQYHVDLAFRHDATGGADTIPLNLTVVPPDTVEPPPENHPPSAFVLLLPPDSAKVEVLQPITTFAWQKSVDPDLNDTVHYVLYLDAGGGQDLVSLPTSDTSMTVDVLSALDGAAYINSWIQWWVWAVSNTDIVESTERFAFYFLGDVVPGNSLNPIVFGVASLSPNPFNSRLLIDYGLDKAGEATVSIYDLFGREVSVLSSGRQAAGRYRLVWDASAVPSGLYLVRLSDATRVQTRKVVLVR